MHCFDRVKMGGEKSKGRHLDGRSKIGVNKNRREKYL